MAISKHPYEQLAALLEYPGAGFRDALADNAVDVPAFDGWAAAAGDADLEEQYTRTFDLHAPCCLDVGWQLFGESYKRGAFLVKVKAAARRHGIDGVTPELADHLPNILKLIPRLAPDEDPRGLVVEAVLPAVVRMREALATRANPYGALLDAVAARLAADFEVSDGELATAGERVRAPAGADQPVGCALRAGRCP